MNTAAPLFIFLSILGLAQTPSPMIPVHREMGGYVAEWALLGPYPNPPGDGENEASGFDVDHLQPFGGETASNLPSPPATPSPQSGDTVVIPWKTAAAPGGLLDLDAAVSPADDVLAYAAVTLEAPRDGRWTLRFGANNGLRVWVDGRLLLDEPEIERYERDSMVIPVTLKAGSNLLLAKVGEWTGEWRLSCRVSPFEVEEYRRREDFTLRTTADLRQECFLIPLREAVAFETATFTLTDTVAGGTLWSAPWDGGDVISIPPGDPGLHRGLTIRRTFADGEPSEQTYDLRPLKPGSEYMLFENGATNYRIVTPLSASPGEQEAARLLADVLKTISGADFPIVTDDTPPEPREIVVGAGTRLANQPVESFPRFEPYNEAHAIRTNGETIYIWGGRQRGTLYAAYTFLERALGCQWYAPGVQRISRRAIWRFSTLHWDEHPAIGFRCVDYASVYEPGITQAFRVNSQRALRTDPPGGIESMWFEHTFSILLPPDEFFPVHPEYYALRNGKRVPSQLCLSNPDVLRIAIERLRVYMREHPEYRTYHLAQNDNIAYCECPACAELARRYGGQSGLLLWFVNQAAEALLPEAPQKLIGTFAYQYTRKPPTGIVPNPGVAIVLCSLECDFSRPITDPANTAFLDDLGGWRVLTDQLFVWDYTANYTCYLLPHPNFGVLKDNIRAYIRAGARGILEQGNYQDMGGDFTALRAFVLARLLWNPEQDVDALVNDFLAGYYGGAAPAMRRYYDLTQSLVRPGTELHIWTSPFAPLYTWEYISQARDIFDEALRTADNPETRNRVCAARIPLLNLAIMRDPSAGVADGSLDLLIKAAEAAEIIQWSERVTIKDWAEIARKVAAAPE